MLALIFVLFTEGFRREKFRINIGKKTAFFLIAILFIAFIARFLAPPMVGSGGGDEYSYVLIGEEISETGRFMTEEILEVPDIYHKPYYMYPILVAIPSLFFKTNLMLARFVNLLLGTGTVLIIFLLSKNLFNEEVGLLSSFLAAVLPIGIHLSNTPESIPISVLSFLLFLLFFNRYLDKDDFYYGIGSALLLSMTLLSRSYNWIFLPLLFLLLLIYRGRDVLNKKTILFILIVVGFTWLALFQNIQQGFLKTAGSQAARFELTAFRKNFEGLLNHIFEGETYYIVFSALGIMGIITLLSERERKENLFFISPLLLFLIGILFYSRATPSTEGILSKYYYFPFIYFSMCSAYFIYKTYNHLILNLNIDSYFIKLFYGIAILLFGVWCIFSALNFPRDIHSEAAGKLVGNVEEKYPNCRVVAYDNRPVRVMGFESLEIPKAKDKVTNRTWYKEKLNTTCILYYKQNCEKKHIERFERGFNKKMEKVASDIFETEYNKNKRSVYLINLTA